MFFNLSRKYFQEQSQQQIQHQYQVTEHNEQSSKQLFPRDQINSQTTHYNPTSQVASLGNQQVNQYENQQLAQYENQQADNAQAYQNVQSVFYAQNNLGVTLQETGNHGINIGFDQTQSDQSDQEDMLLSNSKHYKVIFIII